MQILRYSALSRGKSGQFDSTSFNNPVYDCLMLEDILHFFFCRGYIDFLNMITSLPQCFPKQWDEKKNTTLVISMQKVLSSRATHFNILPSLLKNEMRCYHM